MYALDHITNLGKELNALLTKFGDDTMSSKFDTIFNENNVLINWNAQLIKRRKIDNLQMRHKHHQAAVHALGIWDFLSDGGMLFNWTLCGNYYVEVLTKEWDTTEASDWHPSAVYALTEETQHGKVLIITVPGVNANHYILVRNAAATATPEELAEQQANEEVAPPTPMGELTSNDFDIVYIVGGRTPAEAVDLSSVVVEPNTVYVFVDHIDDYPWFYHSTPPVTAFRAGKHQRLLVGVDADGIGRLAVTQPINE